MSKMLSLALLVIAGCSPSDDRVRPDSDPATSTRNIVRQIDHILIESIDGNQLFSLLTDTLELPVAWPMSDYGSFASGGVSVGNVNLEVLTASEPATGTARSWFTGFALEPEPLRSSLSELQARGIRHGRATPFRSIGPTGSNGIFLMCDHFGGEHAMANRSLYMTPPEHVQALNAGGFDRIDLLREEGGLVLFRASV